MADLRVDLNSKPQGPHKFATILSRRPNNYCRWTAMNDERYRDADSLQLLSATASLLRQRGFSLQHVDATVVIERPALAPHRERMRAALAEAMGIAIEHVSVKATRGEGMGFVGREEGAAALAIATVEG